MKIGKHGSKGDRKNEVKRRVDEIIDIVRLTDLTLGAPGLIRLQRVMRELHRFIGDVRIEDLPIPYTAVATDIDAEREVWFREGPLVAAMRALGVSATAPDPPS